MNGEGLAQDQGELGTGGAPGGLPGGMQLSDLQVPPAVPEAPAPAPAG
ncbi:hypothetical protein BTZ20_3994 [Rhodococcus sp. MTM3W5.2]|nr:hypothetical protein BTZ20_3994 [Rhodococcus sp. MTM3W5.2]